MPPKSPTTDISIDYSTEFKPPENAKDVPRWLVWKYEDDNRKIPRAPWNHLDFPEKWVSAHDPDNWLPYEEFLDAYKMHGDQWQPAFCIPPRDLDLENGADRLREIMLIDFDDVISSDGDVHPRVGHYLHHIDSYAQISTSKTGVHIIVRGQLPDGVKSVKGDLSTDEFPEAEIEVYDAGRFIAMTGWHIKSTPKTISSVDSIVVDHLIESFDTTEESSGGNDRDIEYDPDELEEIETTTDITAVYDAIDQMDVVASRLKSSVTYDRGSGYLDLDPSWANSKSGTRLACVDESEGKFFYRDGDIGLSLFQVVALEEGIIRDERTYPEGKAFWKATEACRKRGWHIPEFVDDTPSDRYDDVPSDAVERDVTTSMKVFSAAMHRTTRDDLEFDTDKYHAIGERTFTDTETGRTVDLINAVAAEEDIIDAPGDKIEGRADWIATGHAMRFRGATVPRFDPTGGCAGTGRW